MKKIAFVLILLVATSCCAMAQQKKLPADADSATISLPGWCCKSLIPTIENTLAYERGVISWSLHHDRKQVVVVYRSKKTNPDKIEKALSENGVLTEHYAANPRAVNDLPKCCQPSNRGGESSCSH